MGREPFCAQLSFLIAEYLLKKPIFPDDEKVPDMKASPIQTPSIVFIEPAVVDDGQPYSIDDRIQQYALNLHQARIN